MPSSRKRKGFSLTEILIALAVVLLFLTLPVVAYAQLSKRSRDDKRKNDLLKLSQAVEQYKAERGIYPPDLNALVSEGYLPELPQDPRDGKPIDGETGLFYGYAYSTDGETYTLSSRLEGSVRGVNRGRGSGQLSSGNISGRFSGTGNGAMAGSFTATGNVSEGTLNANFSGSVSGPTVSGTITGILSGPVAGSITGSVNGTCVLTSGTVSGNSFTGTYASCNLEPSVGVPDGPGIFIIAPNNLKGIEKPIALLTIEALSPTPTRPPQFTPTPTPTPPRASAVAVGNLFSCARTTAGGVKCWGYNLYGQLGDGTTTNRLSPVDVAGLSSGITAISVGFDHSCARTTAGGVKCWGRNNRGQLGDGTTTNRSSPVDVSGLSSGIQTISMSDYHVCALTTAGGVKCWGNNQTGQLGNGTSTFYEPPVDVSGLSSGVQAISVSNYFPCALMTTGGVKCWGRDAAGNLRTTPYDITGITDTIANISSGTFHACGVTTQGRAMCWGSNDFGQLGDGSTNTRTGAVTVSGLASGVSRVVAKENYSCALTIIGGVKCWGSDTLWYHQAPYDIQRLSDGASGLSLGSPSSHSCASLAAGGVRCWGNNQRGQLGDGTTTDKRSTAVDVLGL